MQAINAQARSSYDRAAAAFGGSTTAMLVPAQEATVPQALFAELRRAGWLVSPVIEGRVRIAGRDIRVIGIEPISLPNGAGPAPTINQTTLQGFLGPAGQTLVAPETAAELKVREGATLATESGEVLPPLHVAAGLVSDLLVLDIGWAQRILRKPDRISRFLLDRKVGGRASAAATGCG